MPTCLSPTTQCAGKNCFTIQNVTNEDITVQQNGGDQQCMKVKSKQNATFEITGSPTFKVTGDSSGTVYYPDWTYEPDKTGNQTMTVYPPIPSNPKVSCTKDINFIYIFAIVAVIGLVAIYLAYQQHSQASIASSQNFATEALMEGNANTGEMMHLQKITKANEARTHRWLIGTSATVVLGSAVVFLVYCYIQGPCSKKVSCKKCTSRGELFEYQYDDSFECQYFGKCSCVSPLLEARCYAYSANNEGYNWDSNRDKCQCCDKDGKNCVDCSGETCTPCT